MIGVVRLAPARWPGLRNWRREGRFVEVGETCAWCGWGVWGSGGLLGGGDVLFSLGGWMGVDGIEGGGDMVEGGGYGYGYVEWDGMRCR